MYTCSLCSKEFEILGCCLCDDCETQANDALGKGFEKRKILKAGIEVCKYDEIVKIYQEQIEVMVNEIKEILYNNGVTNKIYEYNFKPDKNGILMWFLYKGKVFSLEYLWDKRCLERVGDVRSLLKFYADKKLRIAFNLTLNSEEYEEIDNEWVLIKDGGFSKCEVKGFIRKITKIIEGE